MGICMRKKGGKVGFEIGGMRLYKFALASKII